MRPERGPLRVIERLVGTALKYLGLFAAAMKLVQLVPAAVGLAIVFFSPSAWLSATLRRWAVGGVLVGSLAGMVALARMGARANDRGSIAAGALLGALACAAALRFHLALVDLAFLDSWPFLQPLHDFYLGSDLGERLYNAVTALWFGLTLFLATLGLPLYLRGRARAERAEAEAAAPTGAAEAREALTKLSTGIDVLERANAALQEENRRLASELADTRARLDRTAHGTGGEPPGSEPSPE